MQICITADASPAEDVRLTRMMNQRQELLSKKTL
jgi:hypothetical protein